MAQPRQNAAADSKKAGTTGKTSGSGSASGPTPAWRGIFDLNRWRSVLVSRQAASAPAGGAGTQRKPRSGGFRFAMGLLVFLIGVQVIQTLLIVIANQFHLVSFMSSTLVKQPGVFLLSGMRWFDLIFLALLAAFYFLLLRYNIIPRAPFGARARAQAGRVQTRTGSATATVNVTPKTRADRRYAASVATTNTAPKAAAKPATAKPTTAVKAAPTKVNAKTAVQAPVKAAAKAGQTGTKGKAAQAPAEPVSYDTEYARVKAAQRLQRRRTAKR
jgi:hypothetical protein